MTINDTVASRQRLAWFFLLGAFAICAAVSVATPILINQGIQRATRPLTIEAVANQGTVGIFHEDTGTVALFTGELARAVEAGSRILTNATDSALLVIYPPDHERILGRIQLYGNSNLFIERATVPRFQASDALPQMVINLTSGRVRLSLPPEETRPFSILVKTPQAEAELAHTGQYSLSVTNVETELSVQEGQATVTAAGQALTLNTDERAVVATGNPPAGPLSTERNLLQNGDFNRDLFDWVVLEWNVERPDQPSGDLGVQNRIGEPTLVMRRLGLGHADTGVRQIVDKDVTDFKSLQLVVSMRINEQSLAVCGNRGSECPLMVRIEYEDVNGGVREWQQGFYALGAVASDTPDVCVSCPPPRNPHEHVTVGQVNFYESDNLLEKLQQQDIQVAYIRNVSLIASGHTFDVEVIDVALMAAE
ncbi:MAG: hypothetical protein Fur0021_20070 [Candidatus Promineifilaceae bacterium]